MSKIVAVWVLLALAGCTLAGCTLRGRVAEYPTKSGTYQKDGWRYVYSIKARMAEHFDLR